MHNKAINPSVNTPRLLCFAPLNLTQKALRIAAGLLRRYAIDRKQ